MIDILNIKKNNLGIKTDLFLKYNRINGLVGMENGKAEQPVWTRTAQWSKKELVARTTQV